MAFLTAILASNSFRARYSTSSGNRKAHQPEWKKTLQFYVDLMKADGPEGASSNGFNENLALFQQASMWIDATVAASFVSDPKARRSPDSIATRWRPTTALGKRGNWLRAWSLSDPAGTQKAEAAGEKFVAWAPARIAPLLVADKDGWANVPPAGTHFCSTRIPITRRPRSPR